MTGMNIPALLMAHASELENAMTARATFDALQPFIPSYGYVNERGGKCHTVYTLDSVAIVKCARAAGLLREPDDEFRRRHSEPSDVLAIYQSPELVPQLGDLFLLDGKTIKLYPPERLKVIDSLQLHRNLAG